MTSRKGKSLRRRLDLTDKSKRKSMIESKEVTAEEFRHGSGTPRSKDLGSVFTRYDPGLFLLYTQNILIALDFDPFLTNSQLCGADNYFNMS